MRLFYVIFGVSVKLCYCEVILFYLWGQCETVIVRLFYVIFGVSVKLCYCEVILCYLWGQCETVLL